MAAPVYMMPGPIGDRKVYLVSKDEKDEPGHRAIEISVSLQDSVHWVSKEGNKFKVRELRPIAKDPCPPATDKERDSKSFAMAEDLADAPYPFYRKFPDESQHAFQISSGPARPEAIGYTYEAHFVFEDGDECDPHIHIGS